MVDIHAPGPKREETQENYPYGVLDNDDPGLRRGSLRSRLTLWADFDVAQYHLGEVLGVLPPREAEETEGDHFGRCKGIFWSANAISEQLHHALHSLIRLGIVEHGGMDRDQFRFVPNPKTDEDPEQFGSATTEVCVRCDGELARIGNPHETGTGFAAGDVDGSGELPLQVHAGCHVGTVWLSREMWEALGEKAGWV